MPKLRLTIDATKFLSERPEQKDLGAVSLIMQNEVSERLRILTGKTCVIRPIYENYEKGFECHWSGEGALKEVRSRFSELRIPYGMTIALEE